MDTLFFSNDEDLLKAADILQKGGLIAAPTETVYGLCANALDASATASIYKAKGRPSDNPLIVHIADFKMLDELTAERPPVAQKLMEAFWPGPLTLIFKASSKVPQIVRADLPTVAIRFPSHPVIQKLIKLSDLPLAAPSANTSGKPSPTNAKRVYDDLFGKIDGIIDGGECSVGIESTIVDLSNVPPTILRPGGITFDQLKEIVPDILLDPALEEADDTLQPKAPGMKYTHYAPLASVVLVSGQEESVIHAINAHVKKDRLLGKKVGILATTETKNRFDCEYILDVGSSSALEEVATHLFECLRTFDDLEVDIVYSLVFPKKGIGSAIMNRLEKSAGHHILYV